MIPGSGLGHLAHAVEGVAIPYADLPGFPRISVSGHNPSLHGGMLEGVRVAILTRFLGLRVAAISTITNMAAGLSDEKISHEHTKAMAPLGAAKLDRVIRHFLKDYRAL